GLGRLDRRGSCVPRARRQAEMRAEEAPTHRSIVSHFLTALVSWVCDRPRLVLAAAALLCAVSVFASASYLQYHTQRSDLISPHKDYQQRWRSYLAEFGDDDDIVVVVQGNDRKRMAAALDTLAGRVEDRPEFFDRLFYKVDLRGLRNRALMFLPVEAIEPIQDNLKTMGSLLAYGKFSWSQLTLLNLLREARHRAGHITPDKPLSAGDDQFLTQLLAIAKSA